ncbi:gliding motility-associated C-terminal domain-containing protein [uncultured Chitinophaga sp.]|uniref:T9SS type B sorting domain-containing protein n=1 Tax=uncultured Chitinophaga sp. TaxID=339340 RepID=UPI0026162BD8|nr:gliding motility-associated C-terminal domain-containing protein [uncultured Chitinophaga sp.]
MHGPCGSSANIAGVLNTYYPALNNVNAGDLVISLGTPIGNGRPLLQGDRILIIQMQDATINAVNSPAYGSNGTDGNGYLDLGYSGQFEFAEVSSFTAGVLTLTTPLQFSYRAVSGIPNRKSAYQVVRVPVYTNAVVTADVTAAPWDGNAGGIVAFHVWQTLDIGGHEITASGGGFRPGKINSAGGAYNLQDYVRVTYGSFGEKGEGIAGTPEGTYAATAGGYENGSFSRGAPANAGGGGNAHNAGGGGAANYGDGGKGGYQYSGPQDVGGRGGKGIKTALPGRIIMGGGGGGGHQNNAAATGGGPGGGIIMITANTITGAGAFTTNGISAGPSTDDGAGGGGAGGSIVLAYNGALPAGITFSARGGDGGNETFLARHGCGGGAGGGVIITSTAAAATDVAGGMRGLSNGTEWGALDGEPGMVMNTDLMPLFPTSTSLPVLEVVPDAVVCAPATVDITSAAIITNRSQGPQYELSYWTDPITTVPVANPRAIDQSGTYYIRIFNNNTRCERVAAVQVTVHPQPVITLGTSDTSVCAPGRVDITSPAIIASRSQGPEYELSYWTDAALSIPLVNARAVDQTGRYYIRLLNTNTGCDTVTSVQVTIHPWPLLTLQTNDTALCAPATIDLASTAVIRYRDQGPQYTLSFWADAAATIPVANPAAIGRSGTYYIRLSSSVSSCVTVAAVQITIRPQPVLTLTATPPSCTGSNNGIIIPAAANGTAPYQYSSDDGLNWQDSIAANLPAGTYHILARDSYGCISPSVSAVLNDPPQLTLREDTRGHADVTCNGISDGQLQFAAAGGTNGYQYTIMSDAGEDISNTTGRFTGLPAGRYTVTVTDAAQCSERTEAVIQEPPLLSAALIAKDNLDCDAHPRGKISLSASGGVPPYWFSTGESSWQRDSVFKDLAAGVYTLNVRDGNNCLSAPLSAEIEIGDECEMLFPNAFSPNGDGVNDLFRPKYYKRVSNYRLTVYNRWGALIFQSNDPATGWDGQFKGVLAETGTFVWVAAFTNRSGQPQVMRGTVTLVK